MGFDSWTCLSTEKGGGLVPDELICIVKMAACRLHLDKKSQQLFTTDVCDGYISTSWDTAQIGARSGVLFSAEATYEDKEWRINFLLHSGDLERGAKLLENGEDLEGPEAYVSVNIPVKLSVDQLYDFHDLRSRRVH